MNDFLTEDTKAIILLCGVFGKERPEKPLSLTEYSSLVHWLIKVKMRPRDLLEKEHIPEAALGSKIGQQRLESLLTRGVQLGFAVEEWQRNGIWIISRSDTDYPSRYKKHLKDKAPPLLFGVGERSLLTGGGLGIVGSRDVDHDGEIFTRKVAELCARDQIPVVSGGARGVDQIAMTTALDVGGMSIGILAENLLKKSLERNARHAIADGRLLLLSACHPTARFTVGTAMGRNKLIYAMADYGLVVSSAHKKGGTWAGATEELKRDSPRVVFVRTGSNLPQGNNKLLELGAISWPKSIDHNKLQDQLTEAISNGNQQKRAKQETIFDVIENIKDAKPDNRKNNANGKESIAEPFPKHIPVTVYESVLPLILNKTNTPIASEELAEVLDVGKTQLNVWLKKAVDDGVIKKFSRPVRYQAIKDSRAQQGATVSSQYSTNYP